MLFDLRGSGRRRTVKIVYITLAFLMGGGLVLFGIGGGGALPGGLVDAITQGGSAATTAPTASAQQEAAATAKARANPTDAALWAAVARARFNLANSGDNVDQNTGNYTDAGAAQLRAAGPRVGGARRARGREPGLARRQPHGPGLRRPRRAREGDAPRRRSSREDRNSAGAYATLATLAYQAGQIAQGRSGDATRRSSSTEPDMREALSGQLEGAARRRPPAAGQATPTPTPTPTPRSSRARYNPSPRPCSSTGRAADS